MKIKQMKFENAFKNTDETPSRQFRLGLKGLAAFVAAQKIIYDSLNNDLIHYACIV